MIYRSKAPLRIGLAGGGTDVSPYSDEFGGAILNVTISLFAYANIEKNDTNKIYLIAQDRNESEEFEFEKQLPLNGYLDLLKGVYNRIQQDFEKIDVGFTLSTFVDAPAGSGLGTSSTLVVAIIGAFLEMLEIKMNQYEIAMYAYKIEREDLKLAGGKQDQYAATFGGVNFMEFYKDDKVIVNPLRIQENYMQELENNLILFYTDSSRESANIIVEQQKNVHNKKSSSIEAMHQLKSQANLMKEALLQGNLNKIGEILDFGFQQKRLMAENISNEKIEKIYQLAKNAGASGGKISGAGGGGFMIFYCPENSKYAVIETLSKINGRHRHYQFTKNGLRTWRSIS